MRPSYQESPYIYSDRPTKLDTRTWFGANGGPNGPLHTLASEWTSSVSTRPSLRDPRWTTSNMCIMEKGRSDHAKIRIELKMSTKWLDTCKQPVISQGSESEDKV